MKSFRLEIFMQVIRQYPKTRMRRLRQSKWIRELVSEQHIRPQDLILPIFVHQSEILEPIESLPGVYRWPIARLHEICKMAHDHSLTCVALFPCINASDKDLEGRHALSDDNVLIQAIKTVKELSLNLGVIADVALDPYTTHGHDGILDKNGHVDNDKTLLVLSELAIKLSEAGADILAPSDMQDGRIGAIRSACDQHGFSQQVLLSYAIKFASSFYGPFRDAVGSTQTLQGASKATYQQNPANRNECFHEAALDLNEGADILMVKPGLPYLDILYQISEQFRVPTFAYQVSGEYQMLFPNEAALSDRKRVDMLLETIIAFKRSGAQAIITYAALLVAGALV